MEPRVYGVELEVDGGRRQDALLLKLFALAQDWDLFYLKTDGSLSSNGIELVTHPATMLFHRTQFPWAAIMQAFREHNYTHSHSSAGVHISTEVPEHIANRYAIFVNVCELEFVHMARRRSRYAEFTSYNPQYTLHNYIRNIQDRGKYSATNFKNHNGVGILETRIFSSEIGDDAILLGDIELVHLGMDFVSSMSSVRFYSMWRSARQLWSAFMEFVSQHPDQVHVLQRAQVAALERR